MAIQIPEMLREEALRIDRVKDKATGCQVLPIGLTAVALKDARRKHLDQDFDRCLSRPSESRRWRNRCNGRWSIERNNPWSQVKKEY